ncbi:hypothetical protein [Aureibacter tunicatorum]|uniref:Uncharacterized protein n=1 Tax=Aureibacter tunicatorum TaxID=866807 RepID=A0AAE3XNT1_9BACT|nr:hypothetical protein [Aureibacter tunicatorum]MDR6239973.1 hypothetical protein [Aureibacter tunicatorum]BDD04445.1 hypothetical protein AUTU_19280 [Aureibacter tunicatorum]
MAQKDTKEKDNNILLVGGSIIGIGILYMMLRPKEATAAIQAEHVPPLQPQLPQASTPNLASGSSFPITLGTRGPHVKALQIAIAKMNGLAKNQIMNGGGYDGFMGRMTEKALKTVGYTLPISQTTYNQIVR